jgi:quercetin dioxygenase-like cupin family protein
MIMPLHRSTKEAVVIVQQGRAIIEMEQQVHELQAGNSFIIPAGIFHSLTIKADFSAVAVMGLDSSIEYG